MSELSAEARALIQQARGAGFPTDARLSAVRATLDARLGIGAAAKASVASSAGAAASAGAVGAAKLVAVAIVCLGVGAGGGWTAARHHDARSASRASAHAAPVSVGGEHAPVPPVVPMQADRAPTIEAPPTPAPVTVVHAAPARHHVASIPALVAPDASVAAPLPPPAPPPPDGIAAESDLLAAADRALATGDVARALSLLDEHATRFPSGALVEEREAARIVAHCMAGDRDVARAAAQQYLDTSSRSPYAARVRSACALGDRP